MIERKKKRKKVKNWDRKKDQRLPKRIGWGREEGNNHTKNERQVIAVIMRIIMSI